MFVKLRQIENTTLFIKEKAFNNWELKKNYSANVPQNSLNHLIFIQSKPF